MNNKDIFQCIFEYVEDRDDFVNLMLSCRNAYKASKNVYIYYRVFEVGKYCSVYRFFNDLEDAFDYITRMKEIERTHYEKTGEECSFAYHVDKCFAPPWIEEASKVKLLQHIKSFPSERLRN
jgi:hypothetical protein